MDEKIFQDVFDLIEGYLPEKWTQTVFFAGYTIGSYSMKFYSRTEDEDFIDCFKMNEISRATLIKVFRKINSVLSSQRDALPEEKKWTVFTLIVDSDLHMKALFEYEDHTEDRIEYEENWRTKFLRKD